MTATDTPSDKNHGVRIIFFILGLGKPVHFFFAATIYYISRLEYLATDGIGAVNGTVVRGNNTQNALQSIFSNVMTLTTVLPQLIFTCLNSFIHQRIPQKLRITGSPAIMLVSFLLNAVLVKLEVAPMPFFCLTLVIMFCVASAVGIFQGSLFGLAGLLPVSYTTALVSGQGVGGIVAALSMICSLATASSQRDSAFGFFLTGCVVTLLAILSYLALPSMAFFNFYTESDRPRTSSCQDKKSVVVFSLTKEEDKPEEDKPVVSVVTVVQQIWVIAVSVAFNYTITLILYPAITVGGKSTIAEEVGAWNTYFIPVSCFLLYNVMETLGSSLPAVCSMWPGVDRITWLPILVSVRVGFVPLFMLCNVQPRHHLPVLFSHDSWYILFMILFALSSGYMHSLCLCLAPRKVAQHETETAGIIMGFFQALGLVLGAAISFAFRFMI